MGLDSENLRQGYSFASCLTGVRRRSMPSSPAVRFQRYDLPLDCLMETGWETSKEWLFLNFKTFTSVGRCNKMNKSKTKTQKNTMKAGGHIPNQLQFRIKIQFLCQPCKYFSQIKNQIQCSITCQFLFFY
jgi:hypothetical protein